MKASTLLLTLLGAHLVLGVARLPNKVIARRIDEVTEYRDKGAARYLLDSARLDGADVIEWLLANTGDNCVVLWRWPSDGATEFVAALLAPRLLVDERNVSSSDTYLDRPIAHGTPPGGKAGALIVQGTEDRGLRLLTR